jgi:hypothetical protein
MEDGVEAVEGIPVWWVAADAPQGVALWAAPPRRIRRR